MGHFVLYHIIERFCIGGRCLNSRLSGCDQSWANLWRASPQAARRMQIRNCRNSAPHSVCFSPITFKVELRSPIDIAHSVHSVQDHRQVESSVWRMLVMQRWKLTLSEHQSPAAAAESSNPSLLTRGKKAKRKRSSAVSGYWLLPHTFFWALLVVGGESHANFGGL